MINEELLIEMNNNIKALLPLLEELLKGQRTANKKWLNYKEAAEHLGYPIGTLYHKVRSREIASYGKRKNKRFCREELGAFLRRQKIKRLEIAP